MSENAKIEWTDHTFNPWWGCQKVGPGCDHCYAETLDKRTGGAHWGPGAERRRTGLKNWNDPIRWDAKHSEFFAKHGRRQRVFCASMADVFDNAVPVQWRMDLFSLIAKTPNLDWLVLTKRIGNVMPMCSGDSLMFDLIRERVWLGATVVNQEEADRDIPKLLAVPAAKRFLSMEPLLGPVTLDRRLLNPLEGCSQAGKRFIDWVIVGGESGQNSRPMHADWARDLRDQCAAARVPYLFKQWGEWAPGVNVERHTGIVKTATLQNDRFLMASEDLADCDGHADDEPDLYRIGKKAAGRVLDGRTWDEVPG